jgi:hypothetical protein
MILSSQLAALSSEPGARDERRVRLKAGSSTLIADSVLC